MTLTNFPTAQPRPLPVFVLADTSGSMSGVKIQTLNAALRDMIASLRTIEDLRTQIEVTVVTFGRTATLLHPLVPVKDLVVPELVAAGRTPMGAALDLVRTMIEDETIIPARAFTPTIVLVSDGLPTDLTGELKHKVECDEATRSDFLAWCSLKSFHASERAGKCVRLAMGIGEDANYEMLQAFVNTPGIPVIRAQEARGIETFFRWVTMSVASRSVSRNPNLPALPDFGDFNDEDLVL